MEQRRGIGHDPLERFLGTVDFQAGTGAKERVLKNLRREMGVVELSDEDLELLFAAGTPTITPKKRSGSQ